MTSRFKSTCLYPSQWIDFFSNHYNFQTKNRLSGLGRQELSAVSWLVWFHGNARRLHKRCLPGQNEYFSYSYRELDSIFGRGQFIPLNKKTGIFQVHKHFGNAGKGHTRGYELSPVVDRLLMRFRMEYLSTDVDMTNIHGEKLQNLPSGILGTRRNNQRNKFWRNIQFNGLIPVRRDCLRKLIATYWDLWGELKAQKPFQNALLERVELILRQATSVLITSNNSIAPGFFPMTYEESESGRLYAPGINLQNCVRLVRFAALHDAYDLDIENCHFNLLSQLYKAKNEVELGPIQDYLVSPKRVQEKIATDLEVDRDAIKRIIISLIYDAPRSTSSKCSIVQSLGCQDKAAALLSNKFFRELSDETRQISTAICKEARQNARSGSIINHASCGLKLRDKPSRGEIVAHLLQGTEAVILKECIEMCNVDGYTPMLLQHDGLSIHAPWDTEQLSKHVENKLGFKVKFTQKKLDFEQQIKMTFPESPNAESLYRHGIQESW